MFNERELTTKKITQTVPAWTVLTTWIYSHNDSAALTLEFTVQEMAGPGIQHRASRSVPKDSVVTER